MKPVLEHPTLEPEGPPAAKLLEYATYPTPWHFHPEYELVLVTESTCKRLNGENISNFKPGDLAFIGPDLPHLYRNEPIYYKPRSSDTPQPPGSLRAKSIVIHFSESSFGGNLLSLPETRKLQALFTRSLRGLEITGTT